MRTYETLIANSLANRTGLLVRHLLWIRAKNRDTLATETIGLWDGDDHAAFTIDSVVRQYFGVGALLAVPDLTARAGLEVWQPEVSVSGIAPEATSRPVVARSSPPSATAARRDRVSRARNSAA